MVSSSTACPVTTESLSSARAKSNARQIFPAINFAGQFCLYSHCLKRPKYEMCVLVNILRNCLLCILKNNLQENSTLLKKQNV